MITTLKDTNAQAIQNTVYKLRHNLGSAAAMVFSLIVVADNNDYDAVMDACVEAGREHPSRILLVADGSARTTRLDAEVHIGEDVPGELIALKFHGDLGDHKDSTLLPLLLPDSPVIVWWPGQAPASLADDPVGRLGKRRISDAMGSRRPLESLFTRAQNLTPGDVDLAWTRITPWRALLTSSLDHYPAEVTRASVHAAGNSASGLLLASWLRSRLGCMVEFVPGEGPGITEATLETTEGDIRVVRTDGQMASCEAPRTSRRSVALRRRGVRALITEELRRLDPDPIFAGAMESLVEHFSEHISDALATTSTAGRLGGQSE